jgi:hypothetical protein
MSSFPPRNWEVRYLQDMDTLTAEPDGHKLSLAALLAVNPAGAWEGNFRLVLAGTETSLSGCQSRTSYHTSPWKDTR